MSLDAWLLFSWCFLIDSFQFGLAVGHDALYATGIALGDHALSDYASGWNSMSIGNHIAVVSWLLLAFQNAAHQIDTVYTQFRIVVERLLLEALLLRLNMLCDLIGTRIGLVKAVWDSFRFQHWATRHHSSILFSFQLISVYLFIAILFLLIQILFRSLWLMRLSLDYVVHHYVLIVG